LVQLVKTCYFSSLNQILAVENNWLSPVTCEQILAPHITKLPAGLTVSRVVSMRQATEIV
jgi:hypothetical protein